MDIITKLAKSISYGEERSLDTVKYIVIHYTGNKGDTAKNNADYFANSNTRSAGAHFFVDKAGKVYKSVNMNRSAYAVGGSIQLPMVPGHITESARMPTASALNCVTAAKKRTGRR